MDTARRRTLACLGALGTMPALLARGPNAVAKEPLSESVREHRLRAAVARVNLVGSGYPATEVWSYNGMIPGPTLRAKQGERLRVAVENQLAESTTVHWHGLRLPNAMDGVPEVTQKPIAARGGRFTYEFALPDAGTFWYHPHSNGNVQVDLGLAGALIVEERAPVAVDRDVLWVIDDWRLTREAQIPRDFASFMDASHAGRIGNTVTINGAVPDRFAVRAGERIRLRLLNVANARIFSLAFRGHAPIVVAHDGMPCEPHAPENGRVVLGPGMRADLIIEMTQAPKAAFEVIDDFAPRDPYRLVTFAYRDESPLREAITAAPVRLPPNPVPEPDRSRAQRHSIVFEGGMMGGMRAMRGAHAWSINGHSANESDHSHAPILTLPRNRSVVFALRNDTAFWHPIHLHGHSFRIVSRDGKALERALLADTTLMPPRSTAEIAFVADNPGDWMFHCHVLEHQASGMMATIRVA